MHDQEQAWAERIRAAAERHEALRFRGGATKDFYGQALFGAELDTRTHAGIVSYEPTELVVTVRAGTGLKVLQATLAESGQMLAFEPPAFGDEATVGGCVAAGLSGPRRVSAGAVRDFMLGSRIIDGRGQTLRFGGEVMKNVAGYDVSRLMVGSLGTLGLITEVSLKVLPLPTAELTVMQEMTLEAGLEALNAWTGRPFPLSGSAWVNGQLWLRFSGADAAVTAAIRASGGEALEPAAAAAFWRGIREHEHGFFAGEAALWRLSLPATAPPLQLTGEWLCEWGGALRWLRSAETPERIREAVAPAGGHATLFRGGDRAAGVFHPLAPAMAALQARLRRSFDPAGIFNPGRLYAEI